MSHELRGGPSMKPETIQTMWEEYRAAAIHPDAGETQLRESRYAYFAGAAMIYSSLVSLSAEEAPEALHRLQAEIRGHVEEVKADQGGPTLN